MRLEVHGLAELKRDLKRLGHEDVPKRFKAANKSAADVVAQAAAAKAPSRTGKLRASIRALGQAKQGLVKMGKASLPYAGWIEFGGNIKYGTIKRTFIKQGRYLFPTLQAKQEQVLGIYELELEKALRSFQ